MGKRKMINFASAGFSQYEDVEEEGMPKPGDGSAVGESRHNENLGARNLRRTGPKGEPLDEHTPQSQH